MTEQELKDLVNKIVNIKSETPNLELKKTKNGCPESLYDTLSSFSNTTGGVIVFGIDKKNDFEICGIDNPADLQKIVTEQSLSMEPAVRPLFTVVDIEGKVVCSAEIPEMDPFEKPCFYKGKGKTKGSYIRVGDADLPMTDYEIYSYDAFKYKTEDELRTKDRIDQSVLNNNLIDGYIANLINKKPNLLNVDKKQILVLEGIIDKNEKPTLCGVLNFGTFPQIFSPNLDIIAIKCATNNYAEENDEGVRFIDNKRIDGTISNMLSQALGFIQNNTKKATFINQKTGLREDRSEYPIKALREIILNALIHRDYSIYSENEPIRIEIYEDRIEISNPGGLYGRLSLDNLGKVKSDIRNPYISSILESMDITENRYSGIPTIYKEMEKAGLMAPKFENERGVFKVTLYNHQANKIFDNDFVENIKGMCKVPRTKEYLAGHFGFDEKHPSYFINNYVVPLIEKGILNYTIPNRPKSKNQKIVVVE